MTRRSCAVYATGIVCAHLLIVGIALIVAQVFPTLIQNHLKKVSRFNNTIGSHVCHLIEKVLLSSLVGEMHVMV